MVKGKNIVIFLLLAIILTLFLAFLPYDLLALDNGVILTDSEFNELISHPCVEIDTNNIQCMTEEENTKLREYSIKYKLFDIFNIKNLKVNVVSNEVFVGGKALGFSVNTKGVIVVGSNYILTKSGRINPIINSGIEVGDMIVAINDTEIICVGDIVDILKFYDGSGLTVRYVRQGEVGESIIYPAFDQQSNTYKLGLWLKEDAMGIGTLTYVDTDSSYGALGHAISLDSTGTPLEILGGNVYNCNVVGVKIGGSGKAGQLLGAFNVGDISIGTLDENTENGAFGKIDDILSYTKDLSRIGVGGIKTATPGRAKILCCVSGNKVEEYDIDIIKTNYKSGNNRNMVIRITDPDLLNTTGGIVQGMSGSPIIQNGKLVGAVTHVFLNDSTKGFGLYIDWMI